VARLVLEVERQAGLDFHEGLVAIPNGLVHLIERSPRAVSDSSDLALTGRHRHCAYLLLFGAGK